MSADQQNDTLEAASKRCAIKQEKRASRAVGAEKKERSRNQRTMQAMTVFLLVLVAFVAGFFVRSQTTFIASLGFPLTPTESSAITSSGLKKSAYDSISARVDEVEELLAKNSLDALNLGSATQNMLTDMMKATDDPYAAYYSPENYAAYIKESLERSYAGIGVLFADYNGRAYVADVFEDSEAQAHGILKGDFVVAIDGDSSHKWSMTEVINTLARENGSQVVITWMRPSSMDAITGEEFATTLVCRTFDDEVNVEADLMGNVGYIRLQQITRNAASLVGDAVDALKAEGARAYVLDLRNNPGGYLTQAVDIASLFVPSGVLVKLETAEGTTEKTATGTTLTEAPLVVLVNGYTAGAAEVLTAALKDNRRAETIGQKTLGKGSVQVVRELSFGGGVKYTAAYYLTPLGHAINKVGVTPEITLASPTSSIVDTQLSVALDTARSLAGR